MYGSALSNPSEIDELLSLQFRMETIAELVQLLRIEQWYQISNYLPS